LKGTVMANLTIEHDNAGTIVLRQSLSNIVLTVDQIASVIKNLELAALEIRQAVNERQQRDDRRRMQAWDSERRSFDRLYVAPQTMPEKTTLADFALHDILQFVEDSAAGDEDEVARRLRALAMKLESNDE
jgi:hypothetical protein